MADLFDYLKWRGDLSFAISKFNTIDALILCQLSYINFNEIIPITSPLLFKSGPPLFPGLTAAFV